MAMFALKRSFIAAGSKSECVICLSSQGNRRQKWLISVFQRWSFCFPLEEPGAEAVEGGGARGAQAPPRHPAGRQPQPGPALSRAGGRWSRRVFALQTDAAGLHSCEDIAPENEEGPSRGNRQLICWINSFQQRKWSGKKKSLWTSCPWICLEYMELMQKYE